MDLPIDKQEVGIGGRCHDGVIVCSVFAMILDCIIWWLPNTSEPSASV